MTAPPDAFQELLASADWIPDSVGTTWQKQSWSLVFDTSSWIELYVGDKRSHDLPVPHEPRLHAWTLSHIEYLLRLEEVAAATS